MNTSQHSGLSLALVLTTMAASCGGARSSTEYTPGPIADFRNASLAEVRDAQDQIILSGKFVESPADDDDIERKAALAATGIDADASGEVEVESCRAADCRSQEIEFSVANVPPGAVLRFVIDGKDFATVTTDDRGRAVVERDVPLPR